MEEVEERDEGRILTNRAVEEEMIEEEEEELSPEIQAEIDKEVEEFRLRLESISCNKVPPFANTENK